MSEFFSTIFEFLTTPVSEFQFYHLLILGYLVFTQIDFGSKDKK